MNRPIRMCINCRGRIEQHSLIRLQCIDGEVRPFRQNSGRSFYICHNCLEDKKIMRKIMKICPKAKFQREDLLKLVEETMS